MVLQGCCAGLAAVTHQATVSIPSPFSASHDRPEHPYLGVVHQLAAPGEALVKLGQSPRCHNLAGGAGA